MKDANDLKKLLVRTKVNYVVAMQDASQLEADFISRLADQRILRQ